MGTAQDVPRTVAPGDEIDVWSESQQMWLPGTVLSSDAGYNIVEYVHVNGAKCQKKVPLGHAHVQPRAGASAQKRIPEALPSVSAPVGQEAWAMQQAVDFETSKLPAQVEASDLQKFKHGRWEDTEFPAGRGSLCHDWCNYQVRSVDWGSLSWRHAQEFAPGANVVPPDGIRHDHIKQGALGDCYFLAALSAFAQRQPSLVKQLISTNAEAVRAGHSTCRLSWNGRWARIQVSHEFPCLPAKYVDGGKPAFSNCVNDGLWVPLLEKAWAKLHGSYQSIESGNPSLALRAFSGAPTKNLNLRDARRCRNDSKALTPSKLADSDTHETGYGTLSQDAAGDTPEAVWKALVAAASHGFPTCATCGDGNEEEQEDSKTGLIRGHAYTLLDARISRGTPFVRLRNPWGKGRWRGADAVGASPATPRSHSQDDGDGVFWMRYVDFLHEFSNVDVCRVQEGHVSECVEVRPNHGHGRCKMAFLRLSPKVAGEVTLSVLHPQCRRSQAPLRRRGQPAPPLDVDSVGIELIELSISGPPEIIAMSAFYMRQ